MTTTIAPATLAQQNALAAWRTSQAPGRFGTVLTDWTVTTDDGQLLVTATAAGRLADTALVWFANHHPLHLGYGDTHPTLDLHQPGTAITWRQDGVWIRLATA